MADPTAIAGFRATSNVVISVVKTKPHLTTNKVVIGTDRADLGNNIRISGTYEELANLSKRIELEIADLGVAGT